MTKLMADALYPPSPDQLIADLNAVGADGAFVYVWRPGGTGTWTLAHVAALRAAGKLVAPIIVPPPAGIDPSLLLDAANSSSFSSGPITLDLEPPNLPPVGWEEQFDAAARVRSFHDFDYGTPSNLGFYQPDDQEWRATWIRTGILDPLPTLPAGWQGWQFVNGVIVNGNTYDFSVVDDTVFGGGGPMLVDQHITTQNPVHGKIMTGAIWFNWGDAVNGVLTPVQGFPSPSVGQDVSYWESVHFGGRWVDRIGPAPGQGDWGLVDDFVDTLDVSGCLDPPSCQQKVDAPPPAPPPPPPPPTTSPTLEERVLALETAMKTHQHNVTTSGRSGTPS